MKNSINDWDIEAFFSQQWWQIWFVLKSDSLSSQLLELGVQQSCKGAQLGSESVVLVLNSSDLSATDQKWLNFSSADVGVLDSLEGSIQSDDFVFELRLSLGSSSEPFFEVLDFLFEFDDLVLLFVEDAGVIHSSVSSFGILDWEVNSSLEETLNFVFEEKQSSIKLLSFISGNDNFVASREELILEFKESSLEVVENGDVWAALEDDVLSSFDFGPSETGLWISDEIVNLTFKVSLVGRSGGWWCDSVGAWVLIWWHIVKNYLWKILWQCSNYT